MTARTSEILAKRLDEVGLTDMARRAREDAYHDYFSKVAMPSIELERDLRAARDASDDRALAVRIEDIRQDHLEGLFDADIAESDEWAASPDGQDTFAKLMKDDKT
jgi:hypothetical protein